MATARLYNLARMDTATTGTGTVTLGSAVTGFLSFANAGVADGATVTYAIRDGNNSEIGRGVYTSAGTTLTRATILNSTNSNNALNLSGSAEVFLTPSAQDFYPTTNAQTGTTYTVLATDVGKLVTLSNAASIAVTLPQATGLFTTGFWFYIQNIGVGTVTITPTTSTLNGDATLTLTTGQGAMIVSDGTNYSAVVSRGLDPDGNIALTGGTWAGYNTTFRNVIINGNFDFWQRGTSLSAGGYLADRWSLSVTGSTIVQSRQAFTLGQTDVPNNPTYFHRTVVTSVAGASNAVIMIQPVEGVQTLSGQTVTVSFYAKADASKNIAGEFVQYFGTGGSPSSTVNTIGVTTFALTTSWQKFTATVSIPSISGKTLGTNNDHALYLYFWFDAGSSFNSRTNSLGQQSGTFDIAQVQLEAGSLATPFELRPLGTELALCQRYYEFGLTYTINESASGANPFGNTVVFATSKRAAPSIALASLSYSNASGGTADIATTAGFRFFATASGAGGASVQGNWTASAEL